MLTKHLLIPLAAAAVLAAGAPPAAAATAVGIGDQSPKMFDSPHFQALKLKRVRYFIPWNAMRDDWRRGTAEQFVTNARAHGIRVLLHISTDDLRPKRGRLPSVSQYRREVGRLVRHFRRLGVREWGVWNEANHKTQPTWNNPRRAASYFKVFYRWTRSGTCRRCTVVALDVLDQAGVERYVRRFNRALGSTYRRRARIVGIHNYSEVNRRYRTKTARIVRAQRRYNRRTTFWYTETGGVVEFGRSFPCSPARAKSRTKYLFDLARRYRSYVTRVYFYQWTGADCRERFDAGLTDGAGNPRPAYAEFRRGLARRGFKR